jgi:hypothetical protein
MGIMAESSVHTWHTSGQHGNMSCNNIILVWSSPWRQVVLMRSPFSKWSCRTSHRPQSLIRMHQTPNFDHPNGTPMYNAYTIWTRSTTWKNNCSWFLQVAWTCESYVTWRLAYFKMMVVYLGITSQTKLACAAMRSWISLLSVRDSLPFWESLLWTLSASEQHIDALSLGWGITLMKAPSRLLGMG